MSSLRRRISRSSAIALIACALAITGCDDDEPGVDAGGGVDAGSRSDAGVDGSTPDVDAGSDAGSDAGPFDSGIPMSTTFAPRDFLCSPAGAPQPCQTTEPARSDAERTVDVTRDMFGTTLTFVINVFSMPQAMAGGAPGFDLDGTDSGIGSAAVDANCEEFNQDFISPRDPSHIGVDNAFQGLVGTIEGLLDAASCPGMVTDGCLDANFATAVAEGNLLLLVEVTGLDSFIFDEAVEVALYAGVVSGGGAPTLGADGLLSPGQTFDTMATLIAPTEGDVFQGRLRVLWSGSFDLPSLGSILLISNLDNPELRADISESGLTLGVMGATTAVDAIVMRAEESMPGIGATIRSVVESVADVSPSALDPAVCEHVSSGYFIEAVAATRL